MPRKKNLLDYIILSFFAMCMGLALCACMFYVTRATDREYLNQGKWVLSMMALSLLALLGSRLARKAGDKMPDRAKTAVMCIICALLVAAGVALRLWAIWSIPIEPDSDFETYYRMAGELLRDTLMSPDAAADRRYIALYPHTIGFPMLLLWPTFSLFGESVLNALYANLVCSCIGILLTGHIARRLSGRIGAVVAVGLMSLWPSHIFYSTMVATEPSFTMLILLAADIMIGLLDREKGSLYELNPGRSIGMMMLLGVVLALAGAIRPMAIILLAAYCVAQLFVTGDPTNRIKLDGARYATSQPIICIVLVLLCYLVTNFVISRTVSDMIGEKPASGLSASGYNLMVGLNSESGGLWNETDSNFFAAAYESTGSANAAHQACMEVAVQRFQAEPENVLNLMVSKFCDLWGTDDFGIDWVLLWTGQQNTLTPELQSLLEEIRPLGRVMYMALLLFAAIGCMEAWRRRWAPPPMVLVCMLFFLGTALSHMLLETQVRYHYNMIPFLILLASWTISNWGMFPQEKEKLRVVYQDRTVESGPEKDHTRFDMAKALADGHIFVSTTQNVADQAKAEAEAKAAEEAVVESTPDAEPETPTEEPTEEVATETEETEEAVTEEATEEVDTASEEDAESDESDEPADAEQPAIEPEDVSEEADASEEIPSEQPETSPDNEATEITEVEEVSEETDDTEGIAKIELPASWQKDETVDTTIAMEKLTTAADEAEKARKVELLVSWRQKEEAADESGNAADEPEIVSEVEPAVEAEVVAESEPEIVPEVEPVVEVEAVADAEPEIADEPEAEADETTAAAPEIAAVPDTTVVVPAPVAETEVDTDEDAPETATLMLMVYEKVGENKSVQIYKNKAFPLVEGTWQIANNAGKKPQITAQVKFLGRIGRKTARINIVLYEKTCENKNTMLYCRKGCCISADEWLLYNNEGDKRKITVCMKMQEEKAGEYV